MQSLINPWAGRFSKKMSNDLISFNTSLPIEERLFEADILASIAHIKMLEYSSLITTNEKDILLHGLEELLNEWKKGEIILDDELEDIHMNIEVLLYEKVGEIGKKIHTARSRNDQQAVAQRIYFKQSTYDLIDEIKELEKAILECCVKHKSVIMPSYTHLQRAEFTKFSHWLSTYIIMLDRDRSRFTQCMERADECPLGACASTGTSLKIDRNYTSEILNFKQPTIHSIDSVSDRDYLIEFASHASILMMHLSRLSEEIIIFNSQEFNFIELDDAYCTGSSIMPQKKNPDVLELIRGKSATVLGNSVTLLTLIKSLSLGYNKDFQEDKYAWFSAYDNSIMSVKIMKKIINTIKMHKENMREACSHGHILATEYANYLVQKGIPFREAHKIVGNLVKRAESRKVDISNLTYEELKDTCNMFGQEIKDKEIEDFLIHKNSLGSSGKIALEELFKQIKKLLN